MQTITAVIPARNEEKNILRCIKSVKWCDKIIVIWMGNDKTMKDDFRHVQKNINWVIDHCTTDWILRIDADEVVTPELKEEILSILKYQIPNSNFQTNSKFKFPNSNFIENSPVAYGIPRSQYFCGGFLKGGDWAYDRLVRLFRPKYCRYDPIVTVHEQFKVTGKVGYLRNKLLHYSHPTLKDAVKKFQLYTDIEAGDLKVSKLHALWNLVFLPLYVFFRWMIWHHGYRDGPRGLLAGVMRAWYEYLLYSKYLLRYKK